MIVALASVLSLSLAQSSYTAPDFRLMDTNGKIVQLSSFKGKPVVLNFWATWCHVCQEELPKINAVYKRIPGKFVFLAMHRDPLLISECERSIREAHMAAEWAVRTVVDGLEAQLRAASDPYLRERAADVAHVGDRILRALLGHGTELPTMEPGSVVVAVDLGPADTAQLMRTPVAGLVLELGSATSHTAILARTLGIPAVVGIADAARLLSRGDVVVVDALRGEVLVAPDSATLSRAEERARRYHLYTDRLRAKRGVPCETRDGVRVELSANVELPSEAALAGHEGAAGIGLYRTEYLYMNRDAPPTEAEQVRVYSDVARVMSPRPVVFRTFDLGSDKLASVTAPFRAANPALGLRGLRLALLREDRLLVQLRAILQSAVFAEVRLMFPMVAGVADLRRAQALVDRAARELTDEGVPHRRVPMGVMIELPSAVAMADALGRECDFFSVGSNDLVQYTLAIDRGDPTLAGLVRSYDPAVLRLLDATARAAEARGIPLAMCGDMAGDPVTLPLVLGLGYRALGMPLLQIPLARELIACLDAGEVRAIAQEALTLATAEDVAALLVARLGDVLGEVWEEQGVSL